MEIMIDIETLGTTTDAPVVSLALVAFTKNGIKDQLYRVLKLQEQFDKGRRPSEATLKWWLDQSPEALKVFDAMTFDVVDVLKYVEDFVNKFSENEEVYVWGNGAVFDIGILENLFRQYDRPVPWLFRNVMDLRTLNRFNPVRIKSHPAIKHHALEDAIHQAKIVMRVLKR